MCFKCSGLTRIGYVNSHEHIQGLEEEPVVQIAKNGSIKLEIM